MEQIKKVALITSGGDAPGMNAVIRAVTRVATNNSIEVVGFHKGYEGILNMDYEILTSASVSNIIQKGGTILKTSRSKDFRQKESQEFAAKVLKRKKFDALIVVGGDGSFKGGRELARLGINVIGIPVTIDLDVVSTSYTIGFDTACNTAVDMIDKIRDTGDATERCFVVQVMGNKCGALAAAIAEAVGADYCVVPEHPEDNDIDKIAKCLQERRANGKRFHIVVVAEGCLEDIPEGHGQKNLIKFVLELEKASGIETRGQDLGYILRGGSPSRFDRDAATVMGEHAVKLLLKGEKNRIVAFGDKVSTPIDYDIEEALEMEKVFDSELYNRSNAMSQAR